MPDEKVARLKTDTYQQIATKAEADGISMAEAAKRLIQSSMVKPPTSCELLHFRMVLENKGLTPPKRTDWVWSMTDVLPADLLVGSKLEPYADARREAELRCRLGNDLYETLVQEGLNPETMEPKLKPQETSTVEGVTLASSESQEETEETPEEQ